MRVFGVSVAAFAAIAVSTVSVAQKPSVSHAPYPSRHDATIIPETRAISVTRLRVPEKARNELTKADSAFFKHNVMDALKHANAAIEISPEFPEALTFRAYVEMTLNRLDAAQDDLEHSLKTDPRYALSYLEMGELLNRLGRFDDALQTLNKSTEYDVLTWQCAYEMSKSWLGKHDYSHALEQINRAASLGAEIHLGPVIHFVRGHALTGLKQYPQAAIELNAYLAASPDGKLAEFANELLGRIRSAETLAQK